MKKLVTQNYRLLLRAHKLQKSVQLFGSIIHKQTYKQSELQSNN